MSIATYIDFDWSLTKTELNDIALITEHEAIRQSLKNIILTVKSELRYNPEMGTRINALLFQKISPPIILQIKNEIEFAVDNFEPRVNIVDITINESEIDNYKLTIDLTYEIVTLNVVETVTINLQRIG